MFSVDDIARKPKIMKKKTENMPNYLQNLVPVVLGIFQKRPEFRSLKSARSDCYFYST